MKEVGDGCDASDVDGAGEAGEDALEELPGEVEQAGGRRRVRRWSGGGGGGEAARAGAAGMTNQIPLCYIIGHNILRYQALPWHISYQENV